MDSRDSRYSIKELKLRHITLVQDKHTIHNLHKHIDVPFEEFDLVSTGLAVYIVEKFGEGAKAEVLLMIDKKQLFTKQT